MEEDEETKSEGNQEEGVPEEEGEEGVEDLEEHGGIDVAAMPGGMSAQHRDQLHPGEKEDGGGDLSLHDGVAAGVGVEEENGD